MPNSASKEGCVSPLSRLSGERANMPSMSGRCRVAGTGLLSSLLLLGVGCGPASPPGQWSTLLLLPLISVAGIASAQQVDQKLWGVDPQVALTAATVLGQTLYVGGFP